jgi:pilus assembly protein FimV
VTQGETVPLTRGGRPAHRLRIAAAGLGLLACVTQAVALSSGAPRGTPLIGRPLQVSIPLSWERGEAPPCVRAEFLQGESPGGPLHWRLDQTSETTGLLRLTSGLPVQEPVVSVQVALGCGQQFAREYVLLSEPPHEARDAQAAAQAGAGLPVAIAPLALAPAARLAAAAPAQRTQRARRVQRAQPAAAKAAAPARAAGPRLKLEPIDIAIDESPVLRLTSSLAATAPAGVPAATAARADARGLFQALNTSPEQHAAQLEAAQVLQAELKEMRELVQRHGAESRAATLRLEQVRGERDLVLNILGALVVVLGGALAWLLWLRSRESAVMRRWWEDEHGAPPVARGLAPAPATSQPPPAAEVDLPDFLEVDQGRMLGAEELLGLKERADFFLAVGQPEKALQLLESQLQEHTNSPFVWLDLLDLCRRLERREDYERLRIGFQKLFAARMPAFDAAMPESGGLEGHPRALSRITQLWGTTRVLKVIEDSLFEDPKPGSITFDLEASRELLLLYGIASEALASSALRENIGASFPSTMRTPLVAAPAAPSETEPVPLAALDQISWPASLVPAEPGSESGVDVVVEVEPRSVPAALAPEATAPAAQAAAAPDIDLGHLDPLLPDDLDFCLSLPAPPQRSN